MTRLAPTGAPWRQRRPLLPRAPPGSTAGPSANGASHTSPGHRPG